MHWPLWVIFGCLAAMAVAADWLFAHGASASRRGRFATMLPFVAAAVFALCLWLSVHVGWFGGKAAPVPGTAASRQLAPVSSQAPAHGAHAHHAAAEPAPLVDQRHPVTAFWTGYLLELALSADNVMVFVIVMRAFAVPTALEAYVLFWAIGGALLLRVVFIFSGLALVLRISWALGAMGALLVLAGVLMLLSGSQKPDSESRAVRWMRHVLPISAWQPGRAWLVRSDGKRMATPLLAVVLALAVVDMMFAFDSIPAIFGITTEPLLVVSSNVLAVVGLHRFYFLLAPLVPKLRYLKLGLAVIVLFIGVKMALPEAGLLLGHPVEPKIPLAASLGFMALVLATSIAASWLANKTR